MKKIQQFRRKAWLTIFFIGPSCISHAVMPVRECRVRALQALWIDHDFNKASSFFNNALTQNPNDYETQLDFGMACLTYSQPADPKSAEIHLQAAVNIHGTPFNEYLLGLAAHQAGDQLTADKCRVTVAELLRKGPGTDVQVVPPDLTFGRKQYEAMLKSLPVMRLYVPKEGWLSQWATEKFAGVGLRTHVKWHAGRHVLSTTSVTVDDDDWEGNMALSIDPEENGTNGLPLAEHYWKEFVFEMLNDQHRERSTWIWMRSRSAKMNDYAYGAQNRAFEQQTDLDVNSFYFDQWKPYCDQLGLATDPKLWSPNNPFPEEAIYKVFINYDKAYSK